MVSASKYNAPPLAPCSFCGAVNGKVFQGFRAMICESCIEEIRRKLVELEEIEPTGEIDSAVPGAECVFCERLLTCARFSLRRWIFGMCDSCACGIAGKSISYAGTSAQNYEF